ncbi:transmembrane protein 161B [Planococcus citri]|uniref:transmembrane protein 161B n=1 Tax=Planococcus citri TaxID=170843 RepID=UPI0031F90DD6
MAILGAQLVITLVTISVVHKLSPYYSFSRWLLCSTGLTRYLYPTNSELRALIKIPKKSKKGAKHENGKQTADKFLIPKNVDIELESTKVVPQDICYLRYFSDFQWLVDFSLFASIVYTLTEIHSYYFSIQNEINLSMLWCLTVQGFALKTILTMTLEYFKGQESIGERSTIIVTAFIYLIVVMIILIIDENKLETGLDAAYSNFTAGASVFLKAQGFPSQGPASKLILKFCLAVWSSIIGAAFVFPGLRLARMHWDSLKYCGERKWLQLVLHINFISPLILVLLWIRPISHEYFTSRIFYGMHKPLMSIKSFESLRLILVVVCMLLRLCVMPIYLQAYLNMAYERTRALKTEVGKITNIDLQKKVASVFYYMCVVALQYVIPLVMCLFFLFMYKTLGCFTWSDVLLHNTNTTVLSAANLTTNGTILDKPEEVKGFVTASLSQVFTKDVYRGLLGFATWWTCFTWFSSSSIGLLYHMYFSSQE